MNGKLSLTTELLGPDGAQDDPNLFEYFLEEQNIFSKPILVGRWGTGKTSLLLRRTKALALVLADTQAGRNAPWYIEESDLNVIDIIDQFEESNSKTKVRKIFTEIWETEIYVRVISILLSLKEVYGEVLVRDCWKSIARKNIHEQLPNGVWKNAKLILGVLSSDKRYEKLMSELIKTYEDVRSEETINAIYECCEELLDRKLHLPVISIEPIETPSSNADDSEGLADDLVSALLDCWYSNFRKEKRGNLIEVNISIPWHRFNPRKTTYPNRVIRNVDQVTWKKERLKKFIEERLTWQYQEFRRDTNSPSTLAKCRWNDFFSDTVFNKVCKNKIEATEQSFDYFTRHSSWRARDLLVLTREAIQDYCAKEDFTPAEFFSSPMKVDEETIRKTITRLTEEFAQTRLTEYVKRNGYTEFGAQIFRGIRSPLTTEELFERIGTAFNANTKPKQDDLLEELWDSELIGVAVEFLPDGSKGAFIQRFGDSCLKPLKGVERRHGVVNSVGFLFKGMTSDNMNITTVLSAFENAKLAFNPVFNEFLGLKVDSEYPIGL